MTGNLTFCSLIPPAGFLNMTGGFLDHVKAGTVVRWDCVNDFDRLHSGVDEYLEAAKRRIKNQLGLKLHRFLSRRKINICIDMKTLRVVRLAHLSSVTPMHPFPIGGSIGASGYPKEITVVFPNAGKVKMRTHIWRKKSKEEGYKLGGGRVAEHQGFYFFRHDRLIQDGGWCGIIGTNEPHMSLARVEVDIPDSLSSYLKVRSNKAGVDVPATFGAAIQAGRARDGTSFEDFLTKAEEVYRRRGEQKVRPMVSPGSGIPAEVCRALDKCSMRFIGGQKCTIAWENTRNREFIVIDQKKSSDRPEQPVQKNAASGHPRWQD